MAGSKEDYGEQLDKGEELGSSEAKSFRALAARMNFVAPDTPDIQYPVKEVCRLMANPRTTSWAPLKKIARYLVSRTRVCGSTIGAMNPAPGRQLRTAIGPYASVRGRVPALESSCSANTALRPGAGTRTRWR